MNMEHSKKFRALIAAPVHPVMLEHFQLAGWEIDLQPHITREDLLQQIGQASALVVATRTIDRELIDRGKQLQWIGRLGSGMELIDTTYAESKGIRCYSSPEGNCLSVAEHTLGTLLTLLHHISTSHQQMRNGIWNRDQNRGTELSGKTIGIFGLGNTGSAFARLLAPFHVTVLAYDKYKTGFATGYIRESQPEQIYRYADVISFHLPLTSETRYLVNTHFLSQLERKPLLINTSRGEVVNTLDLLEALDGGLIRAAGLDVFENEHPASWSDAEKSLMSRLLDHPRIITTPHIAGYSQESPEKMARILMEKAGF